jgi:squalene-associated FAD-dependent desaturase
VEGKVHVIGAGLAGLSAAVWLSKAGREVALYEAAGQAGGRCRSYFDDALGRQIDNGNHLVLSGNRAVYAFIDAIGSADALCGPDRSEFEFLDVRNGQRWMVRPGAGRVPWWIFSRRRRVPGSRPGEYVRALRLARADSQETVAHCLGTDGVLFAKFWEPLTVAVLNTDADEAAAALLWPVIRETFGRGEAACRPRIARVGLSHCFVDPALRLLAAHAAEIQFRRRLRRLDIESGKVAALLFTGGERFDLSPDDSVVLAIPPAAVTHAVPRIRAPVASRAIVNGHFLASRSTDHPRIIGMVGGLCHWLFVRDDIASVTVSAANDLARRPAEDIARNMWHEIRFALSLGDAPLPAYRIVKEKRATFAQTPAEVARRPGVRTEIGNLFLAGDWTDTGLPATIEGSLRSGHTAAETVLAGATTP